MASPVSFHHRSDFPPPFDGRPVSPLRSQRIAQAGFALRFRFRYRASTPHGHTVGFHHRFYFPTHVGIAYPPLLSAFRHTPRLHFAECFPPKPCHFTLMPKLRSFHYKISLSAHVSPFPRLPIPEDFYQGGCDTGFKQAGNGSRTQCRLTSTCPSCSPRRRRNAFASPMSDTTKVERGSHSLLQPLRTMIVV